MESTFNPTSYTVVTDSITSPENGLNPSTNTSSYATLNTVRKINYYFDIDLPENAALDSISCTVRSWISNSAAPGSIALRSEHYIVGSAAITSLRSGTVSLEIFSKVEMDGLLEEIDTLCLEVASSTNTSIKGYFYFGGADLTITYHLPDPAIKSVKIYKKISGTWEAQEDYSGLFTEIEDSQST